MKELSQQPTYLLSLYSQYFQLALSSGETPLSFEEFESNWTSLNSQNYLPLQQDMYPTDDTPFLFSPKTPYQLQVVPHHQDPQLHSHYHQQQQNQPLLPEHPDTHPQVMRFHQQHRQQQRANRLHATRHPQKQQQQQQQQRGQPSEKLLPLTSLPLTSPSPSASPFPLGDGMTNPFEGLDFAFDIPLGHPLSTQAIGEDLLGLPEEDTKQQQQPSEPLEIPAPTASSQAPEQLQEQQEQHDSSDDEDSDNQGSDTEDRGPQVPSQPGAASEPPAGALKEKKKPGRKPKILDEETKRIRGKIRQEKNRVAARKCREKKQGYFAQLEEEVIELRKTKEEMAQEIEALKLEVHLLKARCGAAL